MAVGLRDPVLGKRVMEELRGTIRGCPPAFELPEAGHFVQEWGEPVARAGARRLRPRGRDGPVKRLGIGVVVVTVLLLLGWKLLPSLLIRLPGLMAPHVGPPREVVWDAGPASPAAAPGERPPNIVVILADDLGYNDLTFRRRRRRAAAPVPTPRIDSIAHDGVSSRAATPANATCAPSRAAILTGRYPTRFGFEFTPAPKPFMRSSRYFDRNEQPCRRSTTRSARRTSRRCEQQGLPPSEITIAELLRARGYRTLGLGKWHLGEASPCVPRRAASTSTWASTRARRCICRRTTRTS